MSKAKKIMFKAMIERRRLNAQTDEERDKYDKILKETKIDFK